MVEKKYVTIHKGYINTYESRLTRIKATVKFKEVLKKLIILRNAKDLILLKNNKKQLVEFNPSKRVKIMKDQLFILNQMYKECVFELNGQRLNQAKL